MFPTAPSAEVEKSGQDRFGCRGGNVYLLTTVKDTADSVADSVYHAANGIRGTARETSLKPEVSTR